MSRSVWKVNSVLEQPRAGFSFIKNGLNHFLIQNNSNCLAIKANLKNIFHTEEYLGFSISDFSRTHLMADLRDAGPFFSFFLFVSSIAKQLKPLMQSQCKASKGDITKDKPLFPGLLFKVENLRLNSCLSKMVYGHEIYNSDSHYTSHPSPHSPASCNLQRLSQSERKAFETTFPTWPH